MFVVFSKKIMRLLIIAIIGGIGGLFLERTLVPWLASREPFSSIPRLTIERTTIVNPKEEFVIDYAQALEHSIVAVRPSLVRVERQDLKGRLLSHASGIVITSDGIIATSANVALGQGTFIVFHNNNKHNATLVLNDVDSGVAFFHVEASGLPVTSFAERRDAVLGKTIFLINAEAVEGETKILAKILTGLIIKEGESIPETNIILDDTVLGAPVFTLEGKMIGIVNQNKKIVPVETIRSIVEKIPS